MTAAASLPEVLRPLAMAYQRGAPQLVQGAIEYVEGMEAVNARLSQIVAACTEELQTAQPTGPRSPETLDMAIPRDLAALERGVAMRTIYRAECRSHEPTAGYVRRITGAGGNVRTLNERFLRAIIVDRRIAVLADHTPLLPGQDGLRALILHDLGVVLYAAAMFDRDWERATPWRGDMGPAESAEVTERQRSIMQQIVAGAPQASIAASLNVSDRTVNAELAELRRASGSNSLAQLGYWWAQQEAGQA
ncbi:LuxR C-terminal-related transcriptional regulator [Kitasatospora sp. P5_F3]